MDVKIENNIQPGDVVKIDDELYIVNSLISCVEWDWRQGEYYLHKLSGEGFFSYPSTLDQLSLKINKANGIVYSKNGYELLLKSK